MMKRKILSSIVLMFLIVLGVVSVSAATFEVNPASISLYVGESAKITVSGTGVVGGPISATSSNSNVATATIDNTWIENSNSIVTVTAKSVGTATINVSGTVANLSNSEDETDVVKTVTITVKEKKETTPNTNETTYTKSSDNTLKALKVNVEGLSPSFNRYTYTYTLSVGNDVESLKVTASVNDSKAKYYVSGNTDLKEGDNNVFVTVTAENGSTRTYKIIVTKAQDPEKANAYLTNIYIDGVALKEEFKRETLEYTLDDIGYNVESLNISVFPENTKATFVIEGNENLKIGENEVKIIVTAEDGKTTKEYMLKVNKTEEGKIEIPSDSDIQDANNLVKVEEKERTIFDVISENTDDQLLILVYFLAVVEFFEIIYLFLQLKEKDKDTHECHFEEATYEKELNEKRRRLKEQKEENIEKTEMEDKE